MYSENIKTLETAGSVRLLALGFARGVVVATLFTIIAFAISALIMAYTAVSEDAIPFIAIAVEILGAVISGYCTAKKSGIKGFLSGLLAGVIYILIIWIIASLTAEGFGVSKHFLAMLGFSALGGAFGGVLGVNLKSGSSNRRKR